MIQWFRTRQWLVPCVIRVCRRNIEMKRDEATRGRLMRLSLQVVVSSRLAGKLLVSAKRDKTSSSSFLIMAECPSVVLQELGRLFSGAQVRLAVYGYGTSYGSILYSNNSRQSPSATRKRGRHKNARGMISRSQCHCPPMLPPIPPQTRAQRASWIATGDL